MRQSDLKILWARSGNRCAICKTELVPSGSTSTIIGEMAHIVAGSIDGPRGCSDIQRDKREEYRNLILVCCNDHKIIDSDTDLWTVERLQQTRDEHERWVATQLEKGTISVRDFDNTKFLEERQTDWNQLSKGNIWIISSIIPLEITNDIINPLSSNFLQFLKQQEISHQSDNGGRWSGNHVRPNQTGAILEDFEEIQYGLGQRIQIFRSGYLEYCACLEQLTKKRTQGIQQKHPGQFDRLRVLRYTEIAEEFSKQLGFLKSVWSSNLPFNDMLLICVITGTANSTLFSRDLEFSQSLMGHPLTAQNLEFVQVINRSENIEDLLESLLKSIANSYGFILDSLRDANGGFSRPHELKI